MEHTELLSDYESPLVITLNSERPLSPVILLRKHSFTLNKKTNELLNAELWTIAGNSRQFPVFNPSTHIETVEAWMQLEYKGNKDMVVELIF